MLTPTKKQPTYYRKYNIAMYSAPSSSLFVYNPFLFFFIQHKQKKQSSHTISPFGCEYSTGPGSRRRRSVEQSNSITSKQNTYTKPRPRRMGWQLLGLEQPNGTMGVEDGGAVLEMRWIGLIVSGGKVEVRLDWVYI